MKRVIIFVEGHQKLKVKRKDNVARFDAGIEQRTPRIPLLGKQCSGKKLLWGHGMQATPHSFVEGHQKLKVEQGSQHDL